MAKTRSNDDETSAISKWHHFELVATYLLPFCPLFRKFPSDTKLDAIKILDTTASGFGTQPSVATSGVSLKYHTAEEYKSLSQPQKNELQEWCNMSKWGQSMQAKGKAKSKETGGCNPPNMRLTSKAGILYLLCIRASSTSPRRRRKRQQRRSSRHTS
eukprot:9064587-Ditylum_brightwellii.AAC.1